MRSYLFVVVTLIVLFLLLFIAVEALGIPLLTDPTDWLQNGGVLAAVLGVSLLVADVFLPVPSSLVMVAHGAFFGIAIGTLLSLLGSISAALLGFAIGRRSGRLLERLVTPAERARANNLIAGWGALAVVITRPVPLLAETVAIVTGASTLGWGRMALASFAGSLPPALLYALTGAAYKDFQGVVWMFGATLLVAGSFWLINKLFESAVS